MSNKLKQYAFYALFFGQVGLISSVWLSNSKAAINQSGPAVLIAYGSLWGLLAGFFFLYQLILISGATLFEKYFGLDRLARIHHVNGLVGYFFLIAHVLFIVSGYSGLSGNNFGEQILELSQTLPFVWLASISLLLFDVVILTSIVIVRRRLKYEWWYYVHLLVYAAVLLAVFHQVTNGRNLLSTDWFRYYWIGLYVLAFSLVLWKRKIFPLWLFYKYRFEVERTEQEASGVTSIYVTGKNLRSFTYKAGQFNLWNFRQPGLRSMHHPFTISSSPNDPLLRLSVKATGDFTDNINKLKPGTTVIINGPYGRFTSDVATRNKRLFIAGGIGITPIRSMLGETVKPGDILVYAAKTKTDLAFYDFFESLKREGLSVVYVLSDEAVAGTEHGRISDELLKNNVTDIANRDVWLCGPPPMMDAVESTLKALGVNDKQIHTEKFRL